MNFESGSDLEDGTRPRIVTSKVMAGGKQRGAALDGAIGRSIVEGEGSMTDDDSLEEPGERKGWREISECRTLARAWTLQLKDRCGRRALITRDRSGDAGNR